MFSGKLRALLLFPRKPIADPSTTSAQLWRKTQVDNVIVIFGRLVNLAFFERSNSYHVKTVTNTIRAGGTYTNCRKGVPRHVDMGYRPIDHRVINGTEAPHNY
jgi:hypothetical protein